MKTKRKISDFVKAYNKVFPKMAMHKVNGYIIGRITHTEGFRWEINLAPTEDILFKNLDKAKQWARIH